MNECVEALNRWGEIFLGFAWPMLWQSSLLIVVVFAFDFVFARRIRASVRYALWMVVLVKLILPPSLALPTAAAWWLWPAKPVLTPIIKNEVVTFDAPVASLPPSVPQTIPFLPPPPPELSSAGWAGLGCGVIGTVLLLWLVFRWLGVAAKVRRAAVSGDFAPALQDAGQLGRLNHCPRLKLVEGVQSPAVYGLFRPVILLPRTLAEKLSARQLRAVLLHEMIHLRRGDVWINCVQTLLQIAYWWHPLLWLANARIRRLREEAVDDAVMLALRDGADAYAPTLLEVAKFALRRPLMGLGLVGILESRSALRQRVERLVDFRPPRKAGVTILSLCGIFAFSAMALPMGQGPGQTVTLAANGNVSHKRAWKWPDPNFEGIRLVNLTARFLIVDDAQLRAAVPGFADERNPTLLSPAETKDYLARLKQAGATCFQKGWEDGIAQAPVSGGHEHYEIGGWTNEVTEIEMLTTNAGDVYDGWAFRSRARPDWTPMNLDLRALIRNEGTFCQMDLSFPNTDTRSLHSEIAIPDGDGLIWAASVPTAPGKIQVVVLTPTPQESGESVGTRSSGSQTSPSATTNGSPTKMEMRTFQVGTNEFLDNLRKITGAQISSPDGKGVSAVLTQFFDKAGRDFSPPKTVFFDPRRRGGTLFVYATPRDLDIVERIVGTLHGPRGGEDRWLKSINDGTVSASSFADIPDDATRRANQVATYRKLSRIHLTVSYDKQPLSAVIRDLKKRSRELDPDKHGIAFLYDSRNKVDDSRVNITLSMNNASLQDVVNEICTVSDHPIFYSIGDRGGVVFFPADKPNDSDTRPRFDVEHYQVLGNTVLTPGTIDAVITNTDGALGTNASFEGVKMVMERLQQEYHDRGYVTATVALPQQKLTNATIKVRVLEGGLTNTVYSDADREAIYRKLNNIRFDQVIYQSLPLSDVLRQLRQKSVQRDPEKQGINFLFNPNIENVTSAAATGPGGGAPQPINPATGLPEPAPAIAQPADPTQINISLSLNNVSLAEVLKAICRMSDHPIKYSIEDYGVVFSVKGPDSPQYEMRTFKISPNALFASLKQNLGLADLPVPMLNSADPHNRNDGFSIISTPNPEFSRLANQYFSQLGVNLQPPKTVFYNDRLGVLFVYANPQDLDVISRAIQVLLYEPPMIHINARFIEVPRAFFSSAVLKSSFRGLTNGWVLPNPDFRVLLHELESQEGALELAEPEVTTISGRQTQMRATIIQPIVTNFTYDVSAGEASATAQPYGKVSGGSRFPQTTQVETGPIFDVDPDVLADGYTIRLQVKTSDIDFLGYAKSKGYSTNIADLAAFGSVSPVFRVSQASMNKLIYDGQTLVLFPKSETGVSYEWDEKAGKRVAMPVDQPEQEDGDKVEIVFATATLIDPAGNRSHSDDEIPFAQTQVPPDQFPSRGGVSWSEQ